MTATKVTRSQFKTFINTQPTGTATYSLLNNGVTSALINYNPNTTTEQFIDDTTATISVDSYAPTFPIEASAYEGDGVFEFVDALRKARSVGADAETDIVNVWYYEGALSGTYPAEQQTVALQIDSFGGDGGQPAKCSFTFNFVGNHTVGRYNPLSGTFAAVVWSTNQ